MSTTTHGHFKAGMIIGIMTGLVALGLIAFMALNVARDLRLLETASSDNMQWTISQSEVEFLAMLAEIEAVRLDSDSDLTDLRNRFDIFYSRISTMTDSLSFSALRDVESFEIGLGDVKSFLDRSVPVIDSDDATLRAGLADLSADARSIRLDMRHLTSTGLMLFASTEEHRRQDVAVTLTRLALITIGLVIALIITLLRLMRQNKQIDIRQKAVERTLSRLNTVINSSIDGIVVTDQQGSILEFNTAAEDIFGHKASDVIGRPLVDVAMTKDQQHHYFSGFRLLRQQDDQSIIGFGRVQLRAMRKTGENFPVEISVEEAETDDEAVFVTFIRDVSAQVKAENDLVHARDQALANERMKTEFLATMSHEIRTPLNGLLGNLALLQQTETNEQQTRYVGDMEKSGRLLMRHVSDVLDITQYDSGNLKLRHETVYLDGLIRDIVDSQSGQAVAQGTTIDWSWIGPPLSWVKTDPDRLLHILQNLVGNAVKFTHDGEIRITLEALSTDGPKREVMFRISDTGIGVAPELAEKIFDDFVTGHTSYDRRVGGTGLGLGIARRFATGMNGDIGFEDNDGNGATFWVLLPLEPSTPENAVDQDQSFALPEPPTRKLSILVVEDNEINQIALCEMLELAGHTSAVAQDGKDGVQQAEQTRFDLILMDISMPEMDGRAATRAIRSGNGASADTPIIAITANVMAAEQAEYLKDGMNAILTKPLMPRDLDEIFRRFSSGTGKVDQSHRRETRNALGEDVYQALLKRFIEEGDGLVSASQGETTHNESELAMLFHKAAGSAAIFGATELQMLCKSIENGLLANNFDETRKNFGKLEALWANTKTNLVS